MRSTTNRRRGWAIHPEVGKPHSAVFELAAPLRIDRRREAADRARLPVAVRPAPARAGSGCRRPMRRIRTPPARCRKTSPQHLQSADRPSEPPSRLPQFRTYYREQVSPTLASCSRPNSPALEDAAGDARQADPHDHGHGRDAAAARHVRAGPRRVRQAGRQGHGRRPGVPAAAARRTLPPNRLGLASWLVDPRASADGARHRQSLLADVLRHGPGEDGRGFRLAGRAAEPSGVARLAGGRVQHEVGRRRTAGT